MGEACKKNGLIDVVKNPPRKKASTGDLKAFEISGVYLLNNTGNVIFHRDVPFSTELDADIFGSMFQAVKIYVKNPSHSYGQLRNVGYGGYKILVEEGREFFLVVIGKGDYLEPVREDMKRIVESINEGYSETISHWSGNVEAFEKIGREFDKLTRSFRCKWAVMNEDQHRYHISKGEVMSKESGSKGYKGEEIKIPIEFINKIDKIIRTGTSIYTSRDEFIKSAVEIKLKDLEGSSPR